MSLRKYRAIDLFILTAITCFLEGVCLYGLMIFGTAFAVSVVTVTSLIAIMRWNGYGLIVAFIGSLFTVVFANLLNQSTGNYIDKVVIYGLGWLPIAVELLYIKIATKNRLYSGGWFLVLYVLIGFLSVTVGRAAIAALFKNPFTDYLFSVQFRAEALNFVFALIIIFIANKQESVFRDQKEYFLEVRGRR